MAFRLPIVLILGFIFLMLTSASAQTKSQLQQKYGSPDAKGRYLVRRGIILTAVMGEDGKASRMVIAPAASMVPSDGSEEVISKDTVNAILEELVPVAQRGKHRRSVVFNSGCVSVATEEYDRLTTSVSLTECLAKGVTSAEILWKSQEQVR